jgi:SAM-dependent methyltransferase
MSEVPYDATFFQFHEPGARRSAAATIPLVLEYVVAQSVVDVGCGLGTWLAEFEAAGVTDYLGVDGEYVDRTRLAIPAERFLARDLAQPLNVGRRFDLAVCLEVAEHLAAESADTLISSLTGLAPVVLFSAAIPMQSGIGHVNEQWPEYWRDRFARHDYVVVDVLRDGLWQNDDVEGWYRQNLLFFVRRDRLADYPLLSAQFERAGDRPYLSRVHPVHYTHLARSLNHQLYELRQHEIRSNLQLREINLVVFPDWRQPPEVLVGEFRALLSALLAHPQGGQLTVVINLGPDASRAGLIEGPHREVLMSGGLRLASAPIVSAVGGSFGAKQWEVLLESLHGRIILPAEDREAVAAVKAGDLPTVTLQAIRAKQPLNRQRLAT